MAMSWVPRQSVVVPVDYSDESFAAVELARSLVQDASHLHVIHVLPYLTPTEPGVIWSTVDDAGRLAHAREALQGQLTDARYQGIDICVEFGDPGQQIAQYAQQQAADLIVLPSHGRTGLKRLLIGSVAERVVRLAHCPVLVLRD
jgi:nucleotide-binding universal stress UspA family protein